MTRQQDAQRGRTAIAVDAVADCSFSIAEEYATEYLRNAERGGPEAAIRVPWGLPFPAPGRRVTLTFGLHEDVLEDGRRHDEVRFRWRSGSPWLPDFHGTLRFRIEALRTRVLLEGSYDAPLGVAGRIFDRLIGGRLAHASLQEVATRIARHLSDRERDWRAAHPLPAGS
jgi:hypothetical protein